MMKIVVAFLVILPSLLMAEDECVKIDNLREQFVQQVGGVSLTDEYKDIVFLEVGIALASSNKTVEPNQYILFVDRNPATQLSILLFVSPDNSLIFVGADKVSTGNPARRGYFITPLGFIENLPKNMSYRALGTKNSKGWRGIGVKGSRVWDFGWVETHNKKGVPRKIRLLIHATDPNFGEPKLGKVGSEGCVRVSAKFNHFLDYFGILDAKYENDKKVNFVLLPDRDPVCFPGRFVLVSDSREDKISTPPILQ